MARVLINVPARTAPGATAEVRVLIAHPMESGQRRDDEGRAIPRDIIHGFTCTYDGAVVIEADLFPAISANPFLSFHVRATRTAALVFTWVDDHGAVGTETAQLVV